MMRIGMKSQENQKLTPKRLREYNFIMQSMLQSPALEEIIRSLQRFPIDPLKIYQGLSVLKIDYGLIRTQGGKKWVAMGDRSDVLKDAFDGNGYQQLAKLKLCDLSADKTECLIDLFPFTRPISLRKYPMARSRWRPSEIPSGGKRCFEKHPSSLGAEKNPS
jgi:hypothetical protein